MNQPSGSKQKVSIRKISGKIDICLVAMQLLSVATPNKYPYKRVDFHLVNQQRLVVTVLGAMNGA